MFECIKSSDKATLRTLGIAFAAHDRPSALLCLDNAIVPGNHTFSGTLPEASSFLTDFDLYCDLMDSLITTKDPSSKVHAQKLFGIIPLPSGDFFLPKESFLHDELLRRKRPIISHSEAGITISQWDLNNGIAACVRDRLVARITALHNFSRNARILAPCLHFVHKGSCPRQACPRQHINPAKLTKDWLHAETRFHLQQISLLRFVRKFFREPQEAQRQIAYVQSFLPACH